MAVDKSVDQKRASKRPLAKAGLQSEALLWPTKKSVFEDEVENLEDAWADHAREGRRLGADELDVARHVRARVLRDRDDVTGGPRARHRPVRDGALQRLFATAGRPADRLGPRLAEDGARFGSCTTRWPSPSGSSRWAPARAPAGCSTTTRSSRASTGSSRWTCTSPAVHRRPEALMEGIVRLHEKVMAGVPPAYQIRGVASSGLRRGSRGRGDTGGARRDDARRSTRPAYRGVRPPPR